MAATEVLRQADLAASDLPAALGLSQAVGWNQTGADWAVFMAHGRVIGLFADQRLVATAATLPYDGGFGWVSMVIVAPDWRRRGLARRLMAEAIETLRGQGRAALLDATPAGAEVYGALGFVARGALARWEGSGGAIKRGKDDVRSLTGAELDELIVADAAAFGADRRLLLGDILARPGSLALGCDGGYLVVRRGERATQFGPLIAAEPEAARRLLAAGIAEAQGPVFLDLLDAGRAHVPWLEARGFRQQRPFLRMALGRDTLPGEPACQVLAAGPEFG